MSDRGLAARGRRFADLPADLSAGLVAAVVSLPQSIPLGVIAFMPLGPDWVWLGVLSGMYSSIFAGLVAALAGGAPQMVSGPRASASLLVAGMLAALLANPVVVAHGGAPLAAALIFLCLFLTGFAQLLFGLFRLGRLIKYIPYPVIAGFMNGVAVLILLGQVRAFLGLPESFRWQDMDQMGELMRPGAVAVALCTIAAMKLVPRFTKKMPPALAGLILGTLAALALDAVLGAGTTGFRVGALPARLPWPDLPGTLAAMDWDWELVGVVVRMLPAILVLAMVASIDSLLSAASLDGLSGTRHHSNRELIGQGLSNMVGACFSGVTSTGSLARSLACIQAGSRTRLAGAVHALYLAVALAVARPLLEMLPMAAMAGIMVVVAIAAFDGWTRQLMWQLPKRVEYRREILANLVVVASVAAITVIINLMAAVAAGMAASMALFVRKMSKPIVRRIMDGRARRSLKVRSRAGCDLLQEKGAAILLVELDGPLFFGTADSLLAEVESRTGGVKVVILDCRRLSEVDATGVRILGQLGKMLQAKGRAFLLAHLSPDDPMTRFLFETGGAAMKEQLRLFPDTDSALEWAEDRVLELHGHRPEDDSALPLHKLPLAEQLDSEELEILAGALERRELARGTVLFRRGDAGDSLYLLAKGHVTIRLERPDGPPVRLASFQPGVMFGEMALLEDQPRSADAVAEDDIVVYALTAARFEELADSSPRITHHLVRNIARELAARLRVTSEQLRAAY